MIKEALSHPLKVCTIYAADTQIAMLCRFFINEECTVPHIKRGFRCKNIVSRDPEETVGVVVKEDYEKESHV